VARINKLEDLTPRQRETLALIADGLTSKEAAKVCGVSPSAINQRVDVMLRSLGFRDRRQLASWYLKASASVVSEPEQVVQDARSAGTSEADRMRRRADDWQSLPNSGNLSAPTALSRSIPERRYRRPLSSLDLQAELTLTLLGLLVIIGAYEVLRTLAH